MKKIIISAIQKIRRLMYKIQYIYLKSTTKRSKYRYGLNKNKRDIPNIIVSLTSYPKRFANMDLCIKSILNQNFKPDKIIIWLGSDTEPELAKQWFDKYKKYGVEYVIDTKNNYYSHKKYLYAFEKYNKSIIITFDDDLIYPKNTIKLLIKKYKKYPNSIIAHRVHKITWSGEKINKYNDWIYECFTCFKPTHELLATTGAGTLFPPNTYKKNDLNFDLIKNYALTADDIWLKMMAVKNNVKVVWTGKFLQMPAEVSSTKENALSNVNIRESRNDEYICIIMKKFKLTKKSFYK